MEYPSQNDEARDREHFSNDSVRVAVEEPLSLSDMLVDVDPSSIQVATEETYEIEWQSSTEETGSDNVQVALDDFEQRNAQGTLEDFEQSNVQVATEDFEQAAIEGFDGSGGLQSAEIVDGQVAVRERYDLKSYLRNPRLLLVALHEVGVHIIVHKLIYIGLIINALYYVSAANTQWFHYFFSGSALHMCCRGMDFYQIPNGLWAYLHGGSLSGDLPPGVASYGNGFPSNFNVYHPLFTIIIGSFLILFKAKDSFYVWMFLKFVCTSVVVLYFYRSFRDNKYVNFAIFTMLINSTQYIEIGISQFQSVLNFFTFLLLIGLATNCKKLPLGLYYFIGLLAKPIGILWLPVLFFKQQYKILGLGSGLFIVVTLFFVWNQAGKYYTDNLLWHLQASDVGGPIQTITLAALLKNTFTSMPDWVISDLKSLCLLSVVFFSSLRRVSLFKGIFLSTVYFFLFYDLVFEYHYTTLIPILAVCLVTCPEFQTRAARFFILMISLPNAFFVLHFFKVGYSFSNPLIPDPNFLGWQIIVLSRIVPILLLSGVVLKPDIWPVYLSLKRLMLTVRKVNNKLELFG